MAFYWYQSDPQLYQAEVAAMQKFFPSFKINQLQDGSGIKMTIPTLLKENMVALFRFSRFSRDLKTSHRK